MLLTDLQNKSLVNMSDGKNIGSIIDIKIDCETGKILSLVVENSKRGFSFSNKNNSLEIKWDSIKKIGEDVILVSTY